MPIELGLWAAAGGALAGLLAGLMGIGGGAVLVPLLIWLIKQQWPESDYAVHIAIATALAAIIPTSITSMWAHHRRQNIHWLSVRQLVPGILVGTLLGTHLAHHLSGSFLTHLFAGYMVLVALQLLLEWHPQPQAEPTPPSRIAQSLSGTVIGTLSALIGIGGGTMTVPWLVWHGFPLRYAIGTSAAVGVPIALSATLLYLFTVESATASQLPEATIGYLYWPPLLAIIATAMVMAPVGVRLAHRLPVVQLKKIFAAVLIFTALKMVSLP